MLPFKHIDSLALTKYTAGSQLPVWRRLRNEPLVHVDRAAQSRRAPNHYTSGGCGSAACAFLWGLVM